MAYGDPFIDRRQKPKDFWKDAHGYCYRTVSANYPGARKGKDGTVIAVHRDEMQKILGRPLIKGENVHHINGIRSDNRQENLELWISNQPSGQRVSDHLTWAREIISRYGDLVEIAALVPPKGKKK